MYAENLEEYIESKGIPSTDIIIYKDHKEVYRNIRGYKDAEKTILIKGDELYYLYSASKVITCTATLKAIEDGKLGLDDAVKDYLPEFANLTYRDGDKILPCKNTLTVRHLFTMCGGFDYNLNAKPILEVKNSTNNKASTREIVAAIAKSPLLFEPGTHFNYSLCHDILAAVLEVAVSQKFGEYLNEKIFAPLGMENTGFFPTEEQKGRFVQQYRYENDKYNVVPITCAYTLSENYESGGAGLFSCVNDYIKFSDALSNNGTAYNGYQLLKPETVELMRNEKITGVCLKDFQTNCNKLGYAYALGVRSMINPADAYNSIASIGEFGWDGAAGSYVFIDPDKHLTLFYAQQVLGHSWVYSDVHPTIRDTAYKMFL